MPRSIGVWRAIEARSRATGPRVSPSERARLVTGLRGISPGIYLTAFTQKVRSCSQLVPNRCQISVLQGNVPCFSVNNAMRKTLEFIHSTTFDDAGCPSMVCSDSFLQAEGRRFETCTAHQ
jgi:hypothetical protein